MRRLVVKNFGPIKDVTIDLKDYNFFIGGQGVGKSTLAKLLSILLDYRTYLEMTQSSDDLTWKHKLAQYHISHYIKDETYILLDYTVGTTNENITFFLSFEYQKQQGVKWSVQSDEPTFPLDNKKRMAIALLIFLYKNKLEVLSQATDELKQKVIAGGDVQKSYQEYYNFVSNSFQNVLYIPAERILYSMLPKLQPALGLVDQSIPKMFLYYAILLNDAKAYFKNYHINMLNLDYIKRDDEDVVKLADHVELPLNATSSGMQSLIPLLLTLDYSLKQKGFHSYVIEEPECNLYPDNQCLLIDNVIALVKESNIYDASLTITTHSPYIINYLNVLMRRAENNSEKPSLASDKLGVYMLHDDGTAENLMSIDNNTGKYVINTFDLTEKMVDLYAEYDQLSK